MRSSVWMRLAIVCGVIALIGVPGLQALEPVAAETEASVEPMPPGDVWTGVLQAPEGSAAAAAAAPTAPLIVRFRSQSARIRQLQAHQAAGALRADSMALTDTVRVEVAASNQTNALAIYTARPEVLYAEPDYAVRAFYTPNDPGFDDQWGLQKVRAQQAWDVTRGVSSVKVAIVDCGVFSQATGRNASDGQDGHPDLRGKVALNRDFTGSTTGFDDYCNHGTHVAGIVGAAGNNGIGVSGLAPQVSLINAKVLGDDGTGAASNIINGIIWTVQSGARVVNLSLGRDGDCLQSERDAINYAWSQGAVVVAAAGNSGRNESGAPANCPNVISVASTTSSDARAWNSNYGANVDVAAPGVSILSTVRSGGYGEMSGTSMASPHVAALVALLISQNPSASAQTIVDRIRTASDPISGAGSLWAWGRINAAAALNAGGPAPTPTMTATPTTVPAPTRTACPSPRPQIQVGTNATSATTLAVTVRAGAGGVREIAFRELSNANITIGSQTNISNPFTFRPSTYANQQPFTVNRPNANQSTTVSLTITDDCGPWSTFVGVGPGGAQRGTVTGTVRNASNQQPISGATVTVRGTQRSGTTNGNGVYSITDVPVGAQTLDVTKSGFAAGTGQTNVQASQTATANVSLTPSGGSTAEIQVALTWGNNPDDLDIHLSGPESGGQRFHLYWGDRDAAPYAALGADDDNGNGPETVTIRRNPANGAWVAGEYRVWAHNYSGSPNFSQSSARVTVTRGGQTLGVYNVDDASGSASQSLWRSANITVDANGNVSLSAANQFMNGGSSSVLSIPDASGGQVNWPAGGKP